MLKYLISVFFGISIYTSAQGNRFKFLDIADEQFFNTNYFSAIPHYTSELKKDPWNNTIRHRLAICYLNTRIDREKAIPLLEEASRDRDADPLVWLHLAQAYHICLRLDDAIKTYDKYGSLSAKSKEESKYYIQQCETAKELMLAPLPVSFQNLGKNINSAEPDYQPFIDKDEMSLVFTSRRKENVGGKKVEIDGYRSSDIYESTMLNGSWQEAQNLGKLVNGRYDEQVVGMRPDGLEIYIYFDHIETYGDLYFSQRDKFESAFSKPKKCDPLINTAFELSGCMNDDGTVMFFSRRNKIDEQSDLYMALRLPNGKWAVPQKLPEIINTSRNEDMPYLSYDGTTLYFSSDGHNSMGGYDLFKTTWDIETNTFSKPINLGYPINTVDDEHSICVSRDNQLAYVSAFRPDGFGDLDIYRLKFDDVEPVSVIYTGQVFLGDTIKEKRPSEYNIRMTVVETNTNLEYIFVPQSSTGNYVMALPAGNYRLVTHASGYLKHKEEFVVSDMGRINLERRKNLYLKKLNR